MEYSIWIEAEHWAEGEWNIQTLSEKNKETGECFYGKYFWSSDIILVDECSRERIEEITKHLVVQGDFERIFRDLK